MISAIHDFYMMISDPHQITFGAVMAMVVVVSTLVGSTMVYVIKKDDAKYAASNEPASGPSALGTRRRET